MIIVNAAGVSPGTYSLVIESFDLNSNVRSALKTDTIEIKLEAGSPTFETDPVYKGLSAGESSTWALPEINDGGSAIKTITVEPDDDVLSSLISFNEISRSITFSDAEDGISLGG